MAEEETAAFSNILLVLLLVAVAVLGSIWLYRELGPQAAPAPANDGASIKLDLGGDAGSDQGGV